MERMKRLSVIIPGYNTPESWWRRCVTSVCAACGPDDEVICVDDGSRVRPLFLYDIAARDARIKVIYLEQNEGQSHVRNVGIRHAEGAYVAFVDSDDEGVPGVYDEAIRELVASQSDIALFGVRVVWTDEKLMKKDVPAEWSPRVLDLPDVQALFKACLFEYPVNRIYRKSFLDAHGIRFDAGICPGEDTVFNLKTLLGGAKFCFVPHVGYVYYRTYTSSLARYQAKFDDSLLLRNEYWREVNARLGVTKESQMFGVLSPAELLHWSIENMWRFDTPFSVAGRYRFLRENRHNLSCAPWLAFLRAEIKRWVRRCLYVRPIRRWKARRMFPNVKEIA